MYKYAFVEENVCIWSADVKPVNEIGKLELIDGNTCIYTGQDTSLVSYNMNVSILNNIVVAAVAIFSVIAD